MEAGRLHRVQIATPHGLVEIPWESRDALLQRLRKHDATKPIVAAFEAVGASRPVELTHEQLGQVRRHIEEWSHEASGSSYLPERLWWLRDMIAKGWPSEHE